MDNGRGYLNLGEVEVFGNLPTTTTTTTITTISTTTTTTSATKSSNATILGMIGRAKRRLFSPLYYCHSSKSKQKLIGYTAGGVALGIFLIAAACLALFFFCKRRKAKNVVKVDINDTYGDYNANPNSVVEMTDNNDYYAGDFNYEAGTTQTRDINSEYGYQ